VRPQLFELVHERALAPPRGKFARHEQHHQNDDEDGVKHSCQRAGLG